MSSQPVALGPQYRAAALDRLEGERFDIVVIGGGVTGCGAALDAASRGLRVALVEQRDLASGTSSRSSKLIHGGLRYLETLDIRLVFEALRERGLLLETLAPHLVEPVQFLYPLRHRIWERLYVGAGLALYDLLAILGRHPLGRHRHLSKWDALSAMPALAPQQLVGAIQYWDARVDDARFTVTLARSAAAAGASILSSVRAVGFLEEGNRIAGVRAVCLETGRHLTVAARRTINASGVWSDHVEELAGEKSIQVRPSKGIHIVVPRDRIVADTGLITRTPTSVLFVIPWRNHWVIGTTDTPWRLSLAHPAASRSDIDYLLRRVNRVLARPLSADDVIGVFAGLRPLVSGESDQTSKLSREHLIMQPRPGLISVVGGKYTTYRVMARDAVDAAVTDMRGRIPPSTTDTIELAGAVGFDELWRDRESLGSTIGLAGEWVEHLLRRYGSMSTEVIAAIAERPDLGKPLAAAPGYLRAEIAYAATHEAALHLDDLLTRRTRISIETPDRGVGSAPEVAELVAPILGWDEAAVERELEHYRARVAAEIESQQMADDQTADAARLGAPDVRTGAAGPV